MFRGLRSEVSRSEFSRQPAITRSNIMSSKYKSEGNLFLTYKKAPDTDDLYDPSLIGVTYNEKNSEISRVKGLYALTSKTGIKCQHTVFREFVKYVVRSRSPNNAEFGHFTLLFCRGRQRNVPRIITHVHGHCSAH